MPLRQKCDFLKLVSRRVFTGACCPTRIRGQRSVASAAADFMFFPSTGAHFRGLRCLTNFLVYEKFELCFQDIKQAI
jgi:hypothetical protein